ncbi:transcriptional antiterminator [Halanaerobium saccharolyticum]|uniref:Transcriptional antiterminator n=1 Tax=Halanaerobium saccharolyticum TaxID=43595 RepID=A0A4R7YX13_9FIRM|nr:BglG family transcription antiterminator [Halanaerobium saccharolyticum]RAK06944.1 transcriptional antiterminator [Halanaerobium saccharolyticum]TDW01671.1 transcriptional antiterminator [Halanaerobium saccharolyticum]TDX53069.1 transcriptional antiterminator [Halanaerobium saccharolyticum]
MKKSTRLFELYKYLVDQKEPVSIKVLSEILEVSSRTIRYDLNEIKDLIQKYELKLIKKPNFGVLLEGSDEEQFKVFAEFNNFYNSRHFRSAKMRKYLILYRLFQKKEPVLIFELADILDVSSATVSKDLDQVEEWLQNRSLNLIRRRNYGVQIEGAEIDIRHAMKSLLNESYETGNMIELLNKSNKKVGFKSRLDHGYNEEIKNLLGELNLTEIEDIVKVAEEELKISFTDSAFTGLIVHIAFAISRLLAEQDIKIAPARLQVVKDKQEYQIAEKVARLLEKKFPVDIPEDEIAFITIHLMGAKMRQGEVQTDLNENELNYLVQEMIKVVGQYFTVDLAADKKLHSGLLIHLQAIVNRIIFDLPIKNPLLEDIKEKYEEVFQASKLAARLIQSEFYVEVSEDEIGYITIHFGAALERINYQEKKKARVAIVCSSGVGTTNLLEVRLNNEFKVIEIVASLSSLDLENNELLDEIDFIISTIPLSLEKIDVIVVNPFLNDSDVEKIRAYLRKEKIEYGIFSEEEKDKHYQPEKIIDLLKPYLEKDKLQEALKKVEMHFESAQENVKNKIQRKKDARGLLKLLKKDQIRIIDEQIDWKEAINTAGKLLLDKKIIEPGYIKRMIEIVEAKGPYIAIAPEICLAHAGIEDGVNQSAISLLIIREGIKLGHQFDPIKFIFVLAPIDKKGHMPALTDIIDFANNQKLMEKLASAKSATSAYKMLKNNYEKEIEY